MNNTDLQKILREVNNNRQFAINKANNNLQNCMRNKEYSELEYKIRSLAFEIAKNQTLNKDCTNLQQEYELLQSKQTALLNKLGYTRASLEPNYTCKKCNDTGYCDGKLCECVAKRYNEIVKEMSSYSKIVDFRFEDFDENVFVDNEIRERMKKLYQASEKFCNDFPNTNKQNLLFIGLSGVGKTYLVSAIANRLIEKNFFVNYLTAFELNQMFLQYHIADNSSKNSIIENLLNCDLLVIDDLGTEPMLNNVTKEYLFLILNERNVRNKHTIISSNLSTYGILDRYGERVFSRITDKRKSQTIRVNNVDLRLQK